MRLFFLAFAVVVASGCKPPPVKDIETAFKKELRFYFSNLNQENLARKDHLREEQALAERNPALLPPTGTIYNHYTWDDQGFIVENFMCQVCGAKMLLPVPAAEYLCKSCGHCPYRPHPQGTNLRKVPCEICLQVFKEPTKADIPKELVEAQTRKDIAMVVERCPGAVVRDMFEITKTDKERGIMKATVRYVRRQYTYDERATIVLSQKAIDRAQSDASFIPTAATEEGKTVDKYTRPGFHRLDAVYVGELYFTFQGGEMRPPDPDKKDEREEAARHGKEQPVRPWVDLGSRKN